MPHEDGFAQATLVYITIFVLYYREVEKPP